MKEASRQKLVRAVSIPYFPQHNLSQSHIYNNKIVSSFYMLKNAWNGIKRCCVREQIKNNIK